PPGGPVGRARAPRRCRAAPSRCRATLRHVPGRAERRAARGRYRTRTLRGQWIAASAVVSPERRGEGIGRALAAELVRRSPAGGVKRVFLLTETAAPFFGQLGFVPIARAAVDAGVRESVEFQDACPLSAACLWRPIP